ncbi:hypothetical protein AVEN_188579-1 [Araneus ventricosus]|uniref:Uncharacterized protein n=1 Tax=Araneus ventricosus TaxID=182803 RepID=A0A4Y2HR49_ARAVE|nr:hypothetical protein AVEN_188579-1 [Araneus ventricosus]
MRHGGLVVGSRLRGRRVLGSKPDSTENLPWKFGEKNASSGVGLVVGSKLRSPPQTSALVASKRDVPIAEYGATSKYVWKTKGPSLGII